MKKLITLVSLTATLFISCNKETAAPSLSANGQTTLSFDATVNNDDFVLNKDYSINGRTYNFNKLRYWVSNIVLINAKGEEYNVPRSYYLIEETVEQSIQDGKFTYPATKRENVVLQDIPEGDYKSIRFSVGVEPKYNANLSLQTGELSQLNGMTNTSWMWHTSYIFSALAGKVTEGVITKDISVETGLDANYKTITLALPQMLKINSQKSSSVLFNVNVAKVFDGLDLITTPKVGAQQATQMSLVANNYGTKVFTVTAVK